jgi:P27 family predicted phage terminase small subunit
MPTGRPPLPIQIHKLAATYDPRHHDKRAVEPEAPGELSELRPPWWLNARQRRVWDRTLRDAPKTILRKIDWQMLAEYCVLADTFAVAQRAQNKLKLLQDNGMPSPYLRIVRQSVEVLTRLRAEMGFSPVARTRLGTPAAKAEEQEDEWGDLKRVPVRGDATKAA